MILVLKKETSGGAAPDPLAASEIHLYVQTPFPKSWIRPCTITSYNDHDTLYNHSAIMKIPCRPCSGDWNYLAIVTNSFYSSCYQIAIYSYI